MLFPVISLLVWARRRMDERWRKQNKPNLVELELALSLAIYKIYKIYRIYMQKEWNDHCPCQLISPCNLHGMLHHNVSLTLSQRVFVFCSEVFNLSNVCQCLVRKLFTSCLLRSTITSRTILFRIIILLGYVTPVTNLYCSCSCRLTSRI